MFTKTRAYRRLMGITAAVGLATLAGCAKIPAPKHIDETLPAVPTNWVSASEDMSGALHEDWLFTFGDPRLLSLVAEALEYNNDVRQSAARLEAARATFRAARSGLLPVLSGSLDASQARTSLPADGGFDADTTDTALGLGLSASWEVDVWGRITNRAGAAYADARAARRDFESAQLSLAGSTAQAWFTLIEARLQTELAERNVEVRERTVDIIDRRFRRGVSSSLDLRLARSDLASTRANLASRQQAEKEAARTLEVLLGRYPAGSIEHTQELPILPTLEGVGAPFEILTRRPDLQASEDRLKAAGLRAVDARKAVLPRVTLTASLGTSDTVFADLFDAERLAGSFIAGLTQPLFQGGRLIADAQAARARAEDALYGYIRNALQAFRDAENALTAEARLAVREEALVEAFEQARAAERLTERDYGAGLRTIFNLLDARTRRFNAESALIAVRRERLNNRVRLHLAVAGPFSTSNAEPARNEEGIAAVSEEGSRL